MAELLTKKSFIEKCHDDYVLIFDHVPKCGGSTLREFLLSSVGPNESLSFDYPPSYIENPDFSSVRLIQGHICWGVHSFLENRHGAYITFIRNPFDLALSFYSFLKNKGMISWSPEEYLTQVYRHNFLVRHLGQGSVEMARKKLIDDYIFYGVVEYYDESMKRLVSLLDGSAIQLKPFEPMGFKRVNVSMTKPVVSREIFEYFREINNDDYVLYNEAVNMFLENTDIEIRKKTPHAVCSDVEYTKDDSICGCDDLGALVSSVLEKTDEEISFDEFHKVYNASMTIEDVVQAEEALRRGEKKYPNYMFHQYVVFYERKGEYAKSFDYADAALKALEGRKGSYDSYYTVKQRFIAAAQAYYHYLSTKSDEGLRTIQNLVDSIDYDTLDRTDIPYIISILVSLHLTDSLRHVHRTLLLCSNKGFGWREVIIRTSQYFFNEYHYELALEGFQQSQKADRLKVDAALHLSALYRIGWGDDDQVDHLKKLADILPEGHYKRKIIEEQCVGHQNQIIMNNVDRKYRQIPFSELDTDQPILCICSGPKAIFDYLEAMVFSRRNRKIDFVCNRTLAKIIHERLPNSTCIQFPDTIFDYKRDAKAITTKLDISTYRSAIFFISEFDMSLYKQIIRLARVVSGENVFFYSLSQLIANRFRDVVFRLSEN